MLEEQLENVGGYVLINHSGQCFEATYFFEGGRNSGIIGYGSDMDSAYEDLKRGCSHTLPTTRKDS